MQVEYDDDNMCMMRGCTEIDVLPARCGKCTKRFCDKHVSYEAHHCPAHRDATVVVCPICGRVVPRRPHEPVDAVVSRHIDRQCKDDTEESAVTRFNFCSAPGCTKNELALILCDKCGNSFCVNHRMPSRHACRGSTSGAASSAPERVSPQPSRRSPSRTSFTVPRNTFDTPAGAYKGDNPVTVCVYFDQSLGVSPMFFRCGANFAVGRALDLICTAANVPNTNNQSLENQLRLHKIPRNSPPQLLPNNDLLSAVGVVDRDNLFLCRGETVPQYVTDAVLNAGEQHRQSCTTM